ncbi:MAG: D-alanyl-D-alanine dipeptidase [Elusimicrobia bacterium]|nr:MAG: D-alanyl-D-alanine dipeptidase [Elusimicrobiota bacterium]
MTRAIAAAVLAAGCAAAGPRPPVKAILADVPAVAPGVRLDIRYATADNFTKAVVYPAARCLLRPEAAAALAKVQADLSGAGLGLKVWDCYRPLSVQKRFWELVPDPRYVADPKKGSRHNRGAAVDLTLVDAAGQELEMPTGYDDFSESAHRASTAGSPAARANAKRLDEAMARQGFKGLATEWWHFDFAGWEAFPLLDVPLAP